MTLTEALSQTAIFWTTIALNPGMSKVEAASLLASSLPDLPTYPSFCPCCAYDVQQNPGVFDDKICTSCPIKTWTGERLSIGECCLAPTPFTRWRNASYLAQHTHNSELKREALLLASEAAAEIAALATDELARIQPLDTTDPF